MHRGSRARFVFGFLGDRPAPRGFSLVELGIIITVVAVLFTVVITGAGYIEAARRRSAAELMTTIHKASREWALRNRSGLSYGDVTALNDISLAQLIGGGFLPNNVEGPWANVGPRQPAIAPHEDPLLPECDGFTCVLVTLNVPTPACVDLVFVLNRNAVAITCAPTAALPTVAGLAVVYR